MTYKPFTMASVVAVVAGNIASLTKQKSSTNEKVRAEVRIDTSFSHACVISWLNNSVFSALAGTLFRYVTS